MDEELYRKISKRYEIKEAFQSQNDYMFIKAIDKRKNLPVIIKTHDTTISSNAGDEFRRECRTLRQIMRISPPNMLKILYIEPTMSCNYYVIEDVEGDYLCDYIEKHGKISKKDAVDIVLGIAKTLHLVYKECEILHRDINPQNVIITPDLIGKLANFGSIKSESSATLTIGGAIKGFFLFTAPEVVVDDEKYTFKSDMFSLGLTFHYMLTGQVPLKSIEEIVGYKKENIFVDNEHINYVLGMMTAPSPKDRYSNYEELIEALEKLKNTFATQRLESVEKNNKTQELQNPTETTPKTNKEYDEIFRNLYARIEELERENAQFKESNLSARVYNLERENAHLKQKLRHLLVHFGGRIEALEKK